MYVYKKNESSHSDLFKTGRTKPHDSKHKRRHWLSSSFHRTLSLLLLLFSNSLLSLSFSCYPLFELMGFGGCTNGLEESKLQPSKSLEESDKASVLGLHKDAPEPQVELIANGVASLGPVTPNAGRENGDLLVDLKSPPSVCKKSSIVTCLDSNAIQNGDNPFGCSDDSSPRTPVDDVFDPFVPGREDLVKAPQCKKYVSKCGGMVAHQLNFDSPVQTSEDEVWTDVESISDEEMFEVVYENLLEAIVSEQTEGVIAECSRKDCGSDDCATPPPEPRQTGAADSCPGAPLRPSGKSRNIDVGLIRKLEF
ncbi:uncharacterized protein LOC126593837 [Malus sylvestris]|uniref:uncharacterized protein LOC126593837 n=1 Tax=Malus sylvestris TaxID=3752 RepID=UPI0021AD1791|nr:uncharacterized protein LOC126593837 [Malus sylvestris]